MQNLVFQGTFDFCYDISGSWPKSEGGMPGTLPSSQDSLPIPKFGLVGKLEAGDPTNKLKLQGKD
jgi:hypothetical protein